MRNRDKTKVEDPGIPSKEEAYLVFKLCILNRYYTVIVFKTKKIMYEYARELDAFSNLKNETYDFEARVTGWIIRSNSKHGRILRKAGGNSSEAGRILFYPQALGINVIAHEIQHAVLYWYWYHAPARFRWARLKSDRKEEERYCQIVGDLNRIFWGIIFRKLWFILEGGIPPTNKTMKRLLRKTPERATKRSRFVSGRWNIPRHW